MKFTTLYCDQSTYYFVVNLRFNDGIIRKIPVVNLIHRASPLIDIEQVLQSALQSYKDQSNLPIEGNNQNFKQELVGKSPFRNYKDFVKNTCSVELAEIGTEVKMQLLTPAPNFLGYQGFKDEIISCSVVEGDYSAIIRELELVCSLMLDQQV